jgi:hypothetical protein
MLLTYRSLVLLLFFISACLGFPFDRRQTNVTSLASCASAALLVDQFTSFSGNANTYPHVTFFVTNPNSGAPGKMLCTATFPSNEGSFNGSKFYSCEVCHDLIHLRYEQANLSKASRNELQLAFRASQSLPVSSLHQRRCEVHPSAPF